MPPPKNYHKLELAPTFHGIPTCPHLKDNYRCILKGLGGAPPPPTPHTDSLADKPQGLTVSLPLSNAPQRVPPARTQIIFCSQPEIIKASIPDHTGCSEREQNSVRTEGFLLPHPSPS